MTVEELIDLLPKRTYSYDITAKAYHNDNADPEYIEAVYIDDDTKQLVIEW